MGDLLSLYISVKQMKLSIIIVPYRCPSDMRVTLNAVYASKVDFDFEVIIIDNGSKIEQETSKIIKEEFLNNPEIKKKTTYIENENTGFGRGNNLGMKMAKGDYVLLLNPDTKLNTNTLQIMVDFMKSRPDVGISTCKLVKANGELDWACRRSEPDPVVSFFRLFGFQKLFPKSKIFARYNLLNKSVDDETEIDACVGAFMLISRKCYAKVGGFDDKFFMYGEDLDLCRRTRDAGFKVWYYPKAVTIHYKGQSSKKEPSRNLYAFYDAMWIYYKKYYYQKYYRPFSWLVWVGTRVLLYFKLFLNLFRREKVVSR